MYGNLNDEKPNTCNFNTLLKAFSFYFFGKSQFNLVARIKWYGVPYNL